MTVQIVEVLRRSDQGVTKPYICRGDNDEVYFVKGVGAGRRSQISEWVAGKLGLAFGLPIAPFEIVDVPEELLELDFGLDLSDLGAGPAFGSLRQEVMELTASAVWGVPASLQQDVLAFDWWIRNGDRCLTEKGGNPNLFWEPDSNELVVIDHNQAFDPEFDINNFFENHVFIMQRRNVFNDMVRQSEYNRRFLSALNGWREICNALPDEWFYADPEMSVPVDFSLDTTYELLIGHERDNFWNML